MFKNLSYFEFYSCDGQYVSRFPSGKTSAGVMPMPATGSCYNYVFPEMQKTTTSELVVSLSQHLQALADNSFMFSDFYWFVDPEFTGAIVTSEKTVYEDTRIVEWMKSLYYEPCDGNSPNHVKCTIRSLINSEFSLICHVTVASLPQEAIDSISVCHDKSGLRVILGRRAANPPVVISGIVIQGKPGYILYGEHLLPEKKREIESLYDKFLQTGKTIMQISTQDASEALRAIYEEGGLRVDGQVDAYMLKKDDAPGRDLRYWTFGLDNQYGYQRLSSSYNILLVIPTIDTLPEPIDTTECQKGVILSEKMARDQFRVNGNFEPVFLCHVRQLTAGLDAATSLFHYLVCTSRSCEIYTDWKNGQSNNIFTTS